MFSSIWLYIVIIAVVIVLALAFYAGTLLMKLKQQKIAQQQATKKQQQALHKHDIKVLESVIIIVRAMKEEQCDISEGCWRLAILLDSLKTSQALHNEFPAIFELYTAIKHMPILKERKKIEKKARMKLDFERMKVEADLSPGIFENLDLLLNYARERVSAITE